MGRRPEGQGPHRRADHGRPEVVRPVGPLRLRRRRQLQRAGRLHRPLPDRPRRRRPGRRRPAAGRGRIWSHRWYASDHRPAARRTSQARRHPDRRHRPVGRRLHDPAGERRLERLRPRVRPRPRSAGRLRHLRRCRSRTRVNWWTLMAQSRVGAKRRPGHRRPHGGRPRRVGQAAARLARLRDRARPARTRPSTSARTSTTPRSPRACRGALPKKQVRPTSCHRRRAPSHGGAAAGDDLNTHDDPSGHPAGRPARQPDRSRPTGTSRTAARTRVTTPTSRSNDGTGYKADRRQHHHGRRGQRHRRHQHGLAAGDLRPVGVRRQDGRPAVPLHHRPRRRRQGLLRRRDHGDRRRDRRWSPTAPRPARRLDRSNGFSAAGATLHHALYDNYYIASQPHLRRRTTSTCRPARTTSVRDTQPD